MCRLRRCSTTPASTCSQQPAGQPRPWPHRLPVSLTKEDRDDQRDDRGSDRRREPGAASRASAPERVRGGGPAGPGRVDVHRCRRRRRAQVSALRNRAQAGTVAGRGLSGRDGRAPFGPPGRVGRAPRSAIPHRRLGRGGGRRRDRQAARGDRAPPGRARSRRRLRVHGPGDVQSLRRGYPGRRRRQLRVQHRLSARVRHVVVQGRAGGADDLRGLPADGDAGNGQAMTAFTDSDYFRIEPCGPVIGAEISGIDLRNLPTGPVLGDLKRAFLDWKVLFFRGLDPTSKEHLDFARLWGEPIDFPTAEKADLPEVIVIAHGPDSPASENVWHSDVTYLQTPSTASILRAVDLPPLGGDTLWSDMAAAYDGLPDDVKERVENLTAVHDFLTRHAGRDSGRRSELSRDLVPQSDHPVVLVHPE